jgi:hypothetical protein
MAVVKITLRKSRSTWYWTAHFAAGGSFGSNHCGSKKVALAHAARGVKIGESFELVTNEKSEGRFTRAVNGTLEKAS